MFTTKIGLHDTILRLALTAACAAAVAGCANIGPATIPRDRFDYNAAISDSWKEQTLLNIVKLRYADVPVFVEVASVVGGYSLESQVNLGVVQGEVGGQVRDLGAAGGSAKYTDRPTITYRPITGQGFNVSFLTPIPPEVILFLIQSGWQADIIFDLAVDSINGLRSRVAAGYLQRPGDPGYYRTIEILRQVQLAGGVGMQLLRDEDTRETTVLIIHKSALDPELAAQTAEVRELLGLPPDDFEITIEYGYLPTEDASVALISRSMLQVIVKLATEVSVPPSHIADGRTMASAVDEDPSRRIIDIDYSESEPEDAFVSVEYEGTWYYIDDHDFDSKTVFTIVMLLMSLMESGDRPAMPLVTIPAG